MAAFLQQEAAGIAIVAAPVAHEEGAVVGRDVLGRLDRGDVAEQAVLLRLAQVDVERRVAQDQPDHHTVGAVFPDETRDCQGLFFRGDDRLFGKNLHAALEADADVVEMHAVGRADHQQVELFGFEHRLQRVVSLAGREVGVVHARQSRRIGIDVTNHVEFREGSAEKRCKIAEPEAQADDADLHFVPCCLCGVRPVFPWSG